MESLQSQLKEQSRRLEQLEEISRREDDEEYVSDSGEWIDCAGCSSPIKPFWPRCPGCKEETKKSIERLAKKRQVSSPNGQNGNEAFRKMLQQELNKISDPSFLPKANGSSHAQQQGSQESFSEEEKRTSLTAGPPLNGNGDKSHSHFGNGVDKLKADQCEFGTQTDSFVAHIWPDKFDEPVKTQYEEPADANSFDRLEDTTPLSCKLLFGGFTHQSMIRRKCFDVHKSPFWGSFFVLVTLANASVIAVRPSLSPDFNSAASGTSNNSTSLSEAFDFFCVAVLFCEVLSGCIAFGFYDWIHSDYHKLDFAALLVVALEYGASAYGENALILRPFRILRILRPLVKLEMFAKLAEILQSLHEGVDELATVFVLLLFFLIGFCILAMAVLSKSFRRRCVMLPHLVPVCASDFSTGWANESKCTYPQTRYTMAPGGDVVVIAGYPFQTTCDYVTNDTVGQYDGVYPLDPYRGVYHTCQLQTLRTHGPQYVTQTCADVGNPQNGFQHFDNFAGAFVSLFQYMTADSAYDVLWYSLDSEHEAGAKAIVAIMLFSVSIFCTWILVGVFVGVVTGTFARIRREKKGEEDELMSSGEEEITTNPKVVQSVQVVNEAGWRLVSRVKIEDFARAVASHRHFGNFMSCVILVHALTMAMNRYNAEDAIKNWALYGYVIYNCIYSIESFCYAIASSNFTAYIRNPFYFFEFALVMLMWLAIFLGNDALLLVGAIRLYRLMRYFPTLYDLLYAALAATPSLAHLVVFICLVGLAFCVTGRYVFRDKMDALTRSNFGTFYISVLTSFQIFTGDSWSGILYSAMSSKDTTLGVVFGCLLIMAWFIFAQLIISNLFIAIIIENFEVGRTIANIEKPGITSKSLNVVRSYYTNFFNSLEPSRIVPSTSPVVEVQLEAPQPVLTTRKSMFMNTETASTSNMGGLVMEKVKKLPQEEEVVEVEPGRILYCLEPGHPIRRLFAALETSIYFDYLILLCIIGSCIILTITPPAEDIPDLNVPLTPQQINSANLIFTLVFTIELVMRVMSKGLVFTNNAYLRDGWNVVDFTILFFAWLEVSGMLNGQPSLSKQARLFRALRPIRILKRSAAMKKIINALICTIIPALYVVAFQFFNLVVFGLIGMGLFGGKFYRCLPGGADYPAGIVECSGLSVSESDGLLRQRVWWKPGYSFDTFYDSMITLYRVGTFKYVSVIQDGMDVTALDQSPNFLHSSSYGLFFVAYLLVGGLFVMNLFVGFIVDGFNYSRGASEVEVIHARYTRMLGSYGPKFSKFSLPTSKLSIRIRALVESASFQTFSVVCVTANVIFMLTEDSEASPRYKNVLFVQNTFFFLELGAEVLLYSIGYGVGTFIDDQWRAFDLFVFLGTLAGYAGNSPKVTQFAKSFRLTRLIRLMARVKAIRIILETMLACIPRAFSILFLLFIVYSMFALFAVASFGTTRYGIRIGPTANFETYARSIVTSYQLVTGDEWQDMMYDLRVQPPSCTKLFTADVHGMSDYNYSFGDCGSSFSDLYFVVFQIICQCMLLNLFVGMILENFSFITDEVDQKQDDDWSKGATAEQLEAIGRSFQQLSRRCTNIQLRHLSSFLCQINDPIGFRLPDKDAAKLYPEGVVRRPFGTNKEDDYLFLYGDNERAFEWLIRAELNLSLRQYYQGLEERKKNLWFALVDVFKGQNKRTYINFVSWEDVMNIIVYWRKPDIVPTSVLMSRRDRMKQVLKMAYWLKLYTTLRRKMSRKFVGAAKPVLKLQKEYVAWEAQEKFAALHRQRNVRRRQETKKVQIKGWASHPQLVHNIRASRKADGLYYQDHVTAESNMLGNRNPTSKSGLETFLKRAESDLVVVRFLDPRNQQRFGECLMDFTRAPWVGWEAAVEQEDCFFEPKAIHHGKGTVKWMGFDISMTSGNQGTEEALGNLLSVHVGLQAEREGMEETSYLHHSRVWLHIGEYPFFPCYGQEAMAVSYVRRAQSIVIQANSSRPDPIHAVDLTRCYARSKVAIPLHGRKLPEFFDGVAEVIGYVRDSRGHLEDIQDFSHEDAS